MNEERPAQTTLDKIDVAKAEIATEVEERAVRKKQETKKTKKLTRAKPVRKVTPRGTAKEKDGKPRLVNGTLCISLPMETFVRLEKARLKLAKARKLATFSRSKAIDEALTRWFPTLAK